MKAACSRLDLGATGPPAHPWRRCDQFSGLGTRVGVTGSWSFLGVEIVRLLLREGYSVRAIVQRMPDTEARERAIEQFLTELDAGDKVTSLELVDFDVMDLDDTVAALQGCHAIFHTASFVDPNSISGYQEHTVDAEVKGTSNVVAACARAETVSTLILTSSAATIVWSDEVLFLADTEITASINTAAKNVHFVHTSRHTFSCSSSGSCCYKLMNLSSTRLLYSDSQLCRQKKLWFALAKTEAEKAASNVAKDTGVRMLVVNPALITGPDFVEKNATPTIAYLKGAKEMHQKGLLAHVSVTHAAHAHVHVFERHSCKAVAQSRYICFDDSFTDADLVTLASQLSPLVHLPL